MKRIIMMALVALASLVTTASAATFNIQVDTWLNDSTLQGGQASIRYDGRDAWRTVNAGEFEANFVGLPYSGYSQSWVTYCTDVGNWLADGYFEPLTWVSAEQAPHNPNWVGDPLRAQGLYLAYQDRVRTSAQAVGLQLAIWNSLYDVDNTVSSGMFRARDITPGGVSWANCYLSNDVVSVASGTWWEPVTLRGDYRPAQGLMGHPVPEAGTTLATLLMGLGSLVGFRKRFV